MSFARDVLKPILDDMSSGLGSFFGLRLEDILKSPEEFSPASGDLMQIVSAGVIAPMVECFSVFVALEALDQTTFGPSGLG